MGVSDWQSKILNVVELSKSLVKIIQACPVLFKLQLSFRLIHQLKERDHAASRPFQPDADLQPVPKIVFDLSQHALASDQTFALTAAHP